MKPTRTLGKHTNLNSSSSTAGTEPQLRKQLAALLNELINRRRLTQAEIAIVLGVPQPHISELKNYKLSRFSSERLLRFLTLLDQDVQIVIRPKVSDRSVGHMYVVAR